MSVYVVREVWKYSAAENSDLLTLLAISDSASKEEGICWPSQQSICSMTKLSERAVRDSIRSLEEAVEIETRKAIRRRTRINVYRVVLGDYASVELDPDNLPFRMLEPFSTTVEIAARKALLEGSDDRQILPVVNGATTGTFQRDDRQISPLSKEGPEGNRQTEETKTVSSVPADAAEGDGGFEISLALSAELGVALATLTRSERGGWELAVSQLAEVGATAAEIKARCSAYRLRWPDMALTPLALVRHWSFLGAAIEIASSASPLDRWLEVAMQFDPETAHELLDDRGGVDDATKARYHALLDERFAERQVA